MDKNRKNKLIQVMRNAFEYQKQFINERGYEPNYSALVLTPTGLLKTRFSELPGDEEELRSFLNEKAKENQAQVVMLFYKARGLGEKLEPIISEIYDKFFVKDEKARRTGALKNVPGSTEYVVMESCFVNGSRFNLRAEIDRTTGRAIVGKTMETTRITADCILRPWTE